jgi:putative oxidoreductase
MKNFIPTHIARILFGFVIIVFGLFHFLLGEKMAGAVPSFLPGGVIWVYITGLALAAGGLAFVLEQKMKLAGYLLALMLVLFIVLVHVPKVGEDPNAIGQILKDLGLAMGAVLIANVSDEE